MYKFELLPQEKRILQKLAHVLGIELNNEQVYIVALTHSSYVGKLKKINRKVYTYERLEFLGDAVLELIVSDYLFRRYRTKPEGILSATRAFLVNEQILAKTARRLGLYKFVFAGKSFLPTLKQSDHVISDVFESIVGAIYLDKGIRVAKKFVINKHLKTLDITRIIKQRLFVDSKTKLQELVQKQLKITPVYESIELNTLKPDAKNNSKNLVQYRSCVKINNVTVACAQGATKLEAEFKAAAKTLEKLEKHKNNLNKLLKN